MKRILIGICIVVFILCMGCGWARVLQFPAGLTAIEAQAFMGDSALKEIILPEGIQSIGSQAFADSGIKIVRGKDASEIEIAPDAFGEGCAFFLPSFLSDNCSLKIGLGQNMLLPVTLLPGNTSDGIRYSSSNAEIVAVSNSGKISGLQLGNAVITLGNDSGLSISLDVMVDNYAAVNGYEVIAHRGASGYQRENSIAAFEYATEMGADMIELDIRRTSDGKAICHHDASLKINNKSYSIANYTLSKLKKLDSGLCSLEEALAAIEKTNCTIQIDIKSKNLEKEAVNLVKKHNLTDRVCYGCFNKDVLDAIKLADPNAKVVCITNDSTVINHLMNGTGSYNVEVASVRYDLLNPEVIYDLHRAGLEVYVWEIDDISVIQEYINWGVDGVITNYPDRAMQRQE